MNLNAIDGFILCRSCHATYGDGLGPQVEPSGYRNILHPEHVSDPSRPEYTPFIHPFRTVTILSPYIRHMGERALVSVLDH